jgi:DNA replication protein DnaD
MSRPVQSNGATQAIFFSEKNYRTLQTVLIQDFQEKNGAPLTDQQVDRLSKTLEHYLNQV